MNCDVCGRKLLSSGFTVTIEGKQKTVCGYCYEDLKDEYAGMKSCEDCKNFDQGSCTITGEKLKPLYMGIDHYFVQAEKCDYYIFSLWKKTDAAPATR
jgi:hypothetical protein